VIIDGKKIATDLQKSVKERIKALGFSPTLAVILVGDNPASLIYVNNKCKTAEKLGIKANLYHLSPVMTAEALKAFIKDLNKDPAVNGILLQLPLPGTLEKDTFDLINTIDPAKDVDGLTQENLGRLFVGRAGIIPGTPKACLTLLKNVQKNLKGLHAVVIGRSLLVGRPLAQLLLQEDMTVTMTHSKTKNLEKICSGADVIISATGVPHLITPSCVKKGAIVIDVGIHRLESGKITGDVDFDAVAPLTKAITPVPGGVGPMTIAMIWENLLMMCQRKK